MHVYLWVHNPIDCVYMLEHNHVMNVSNEDWIHVNGIIRSASPKGSSQDRIGEVNRIAGLEPVLVGYLPACVLNRITGRFASCACSRIPAGDFTRKWKETR